MGLITLLAAGVSTLIAVLLERICYRPLRNAPRLVPLITAIGASFFLQYTFRGLFGSGVYGYPAIQSLDEILDGRRYSNIQESGGRDRRSNYINGDPIWDRAMDKNGKSHAGGF